MKQSKFTLFAAALLFATAPALLTSCGGSAHNHGNKSEGAAMHDDAHQTDQADQADQAESDGDTDHGGDTTE